MNGQKSRTKNAVINIVIILVMQVLTFIYSLVSKNLFLSEFSLSAYGVVDLFGSFFNSLLLLEMGFGTILIYNLYKPVADNDVEKIEKQLSIFKTIYFCLSIIIVGISLITMPFIYNVFNIAYEDKILVYEIYLANIVHVLFKYHYLNKTSILDASQYKYYSNFISIIIETIVFIIKFVSIVVLKNIYLFFFAQLFIPSISYCIQSVVVNKKYKLGKIKFASFEEIKECRVLRQCKKYIYATIYSLVFFSMDNIIISMVLSTDAVAYTTNYNSLFATGWQVAITIMVAIRGIMADFVNSAKNNEDKKQMFDVVSSFNFVISSLLLVGFYSLIDNFIGLWIGYDFVIARNIMLALLLVKTMDCLFEPVNSIFIIEGYIFKEKWPLIFSAMANLVLTVVLLNKLGLIGAYYATIIALIIKWLGKFYYILSGVFKDFKTSIISRYSIFAIVIGLEMYFINGITNIIIPSVNSAILFIEKFFIVVIITCIIDLIIILLNNNTREYVKVTLLKK